MKTTTLLSVALRLRHCILGKLVGCLFLFPYALGRLLGYLYIPLISHVFGASVASDYAIALQVYSYISPVLLLGSYNYHTPLVGRLRVIKAYAVDALIFRKALSPLWIIFISVTFVSFAFVSAAWPASAIIALAVLLAAWSFLKSLYEHFFVGMNRLLENYSAASLYQSLLYSLPLLAALCFSHLKGVFQGINIMGSFAGISFILGFEAIILSALLGRSPVFNSLIPCSIAVPAVRIIRRRLLPFLPSLCPAIAIFFLSVSLRSKIGDDSFAHVVFCSMGTFIGSIVVFRFQAVFAKSKNSSISILVIVAAIISGLISYLLSFLSVLRYGFDGARIGAEYATVASFYAMATLLMSSSYILIYDQCRSLGSMRAMTSSPVLAMMSSILLSLACLLVPPLLAPSLFAFLQAAIVIAPLFIYRKRGV